MNEQNENDTPPPKSDNPAREARILDAAAALVAHFGYDKTSVSDIAREAAVSKGAIYLHFDSKESLFEALLRRETLSYSAEWLRLVDSDPEGGTFAGMFKNILYALQTSPLLQALYRRDRRVLGSWLRANPEILHQKAAVNSELAQMMQQAGAVRSDIPSHVIAHLLNMLAYALVSMDDMLPPEDVPDTEAVIEGIALMLEGGLNPPEGANLEEGKQIVLQLATAARQQIEAASFRAFDSDTTTN